MPDAGFDHLIFPLPPLPTSGNGTSAPSSGNNRDFNDALNRAGQPSRLSEDDISRSGDNSIDSSSDLRDSGELESRLRASSSEQYRPVARPDESSRSTERLDTTAKPSRRLSGERKNSSPDSNRVDHSRSDENQRPDDKSTQNAQDSDESAGTATAAGKSAGSASGGRTQPVTQNSPSNSRSTANCGAATYQAKNAAGQAQLAASEVTKAAQNQAAASDPSQSKTDEASAQVNQKSVTAIVPESGDASQTAAGASHFAGKDKSAAAIGQLQTDVTAAANQPTVIAESQQTNAVSDESVVVSHQSASNASAKLELALNGGLSATEGNSQTKSANRSRSLDQSSAAESLAATDIVAATTTAQLANVAVSTSLNGVSNPTDATNTANSKDTSDQMSVSQTQASANQPASLSRNGSPNTQQSVAANAPAQLTGDGPKGGAAVLGGPRSPQNSIDQVRFVQRVARAFRAADEQGGQIRLRLSPPELGALKVDVALRNGVMTARLEAETTSARTLLLDNLPALRQRLADQNIKIDRFDVNLKQDGAGGGSANPSPDFSGSRGGSPMPQGAARNRAPTKTDAAAPPLAPANRATDGRINIIV